MASQAIQSRTAQLVSSRVQHVLTHPQHVRVVFQVIDLTIQQINALKLLFGLSHGLFLQEFGS